MQPTDLFWNPTAGPAPHVATQGDPAAFHRSLPGYAPSPMVTLDDLAQRLGIGEITAKIESTRLGLPAFKILGASWATYRELCRRFPDLESVTDLDAI
ncbi:MAG TPA: hypothetical protein VNZ58_07740, partial [Thermomicrobiales bacterium]|nr:hypothetical protein [Thermomicrobiales bacterium]